MAFPRQALRAGPPIVACVLGFATVAGALRRLTPWPAEYGLAAKIEYLAEHGAGIDTLFVGSSSTYYGIVPPLFDELTAAAGRATRSFNLGVGGMTALEADYVLGRVLALGLPLRWVFVEAEYDWEGRVWDWRNRYSPRAQHWHSARHTALAVRALLRADPRPEPADPLWRWKEIGVHLELAARRFAGLGQGPRILAARLGGEERSEPTREQLEELAGYVDLDRIDTPEARKARADFLADQQAYLERVARLDEGNDASVSLDAHPSVAGIRSQVAAIRSRGAEPIYFVGPRDFPRPASYRLAEAGVIPTLLGFNRPSRYPELYRVENHFDRSHLDRGGAEIWTRLLAKAFLDHLASQ